VPKGGFSRRSFLRDVAASSTGAALVSGLTAAQALGGEEAPVPPWPVTMIGRNHGYENLGS
jgi:hypothetical protein